MMVDPSVVLRKEASMGLSVEKVSKEQPAVRTQNDCEISVHGNVMNVNNGGFPLQCTIPNKHPIVMVDFPSKCAETALLPS